MPPQQIGRPRSTTSPWLALVICLVGIVIAVFGVLISLTVVGAIIGVPLAIIGGAAGGWGFVTAMRGGHRSSDVKAMPRRDPAADDGGMPASAGPGPGGTNQESMAHLDDRLAKNPLARVSMRVGIALVITQVASLCIGIIPLINLLNLILIPALFVMDAIAIVTGVMGLRRSSTVESIGKRESLIGLIAGIVHLLLVGGLILVMLLVFGGAALVDVLQQAG